ncbi:DUF7310 family coiled-coil domain-containing protein [Halorientalis salina]|uniref:DUF7310 family coiled-coil domain-containing protein n=1 Tax=Halorientalis salina TaxID=2932266 RepID=UPI0010AC1CF2|nr:hypothetical protein [Halorientalis salina]
MSDTETLDERLRAVERALTGTDRELAGLADAADLATRIDDLESRLDGIESQLADLEASTQAVRGYVGNVRSVNRDVEQRADLALAKVERLEERLDDESGRQSDGRRERPADDRGASRSGRGVGDDSAGGTRRDSGKPRWTEGADRSPQRGSPDEATAGCGSPDVDSQQRAQTQRRAAGRTADSESEADDDGGFLAGLTGSL